MANACRTVDELDAKLFAPLLSAVYARRLAYHALVADPWVALTPLLATLVPLADGFGDGELMSDDDPDSNEEVRRAAAADAAGVSPLARAGLLRERLPGRRGVVRGG